MLEKDPKRRITAKDALNHSFFQKKNTKFIDLNEKKIKRLPTVLTNIENEISEIEFGDTESNCTESSPETYFPINTPS